QPAAKTTRTARAAAKRRMPVDSSNAGASEPRAKSLTRAATASPRRPERVGYGGPFRGPHVTSPAARAARRRRGDFDGGGDQRVRRRRLTAPAKKARGAARAGDDHARRRPE